MQPHFNVWFEIDGEVATSRWRIELLAAVDRHGSITAGAEAVGVPYRVAWQKIHEMEVRLGEQLLDTQTGGSQGGGARLTSGRDSCRTNAGVLRTSRCGDRGDLQRRIRRVRDV